MDAESKLQLKWKFYRLALHLNAVVLLIALTVIAIIKAPDPYRIPAITILVILDAYLTVRFYQGYHATKAWLDEQGKDTTGDTAGE